MSKRVYGLKHATPKMKYHHMNLVMDWRTELREKQDEFAGEGNCPICKQSMQSRPLFMAGEYDYCYSCYRDIELQGILPPKRAADIDPRTPAQRQRDDDWRDEQATQDSVRP